MWNIGITDISVQRQKNYIMMSVLTVVESDWWQVFLAQTGSCWKSLHDALNVRCLGKVNSFPDKHCVSEWDAIMHLLNVPIKTTDEEDAETRDLICKHTHMKNNAIINTNRI